MLQQTCKNSVLWWICVFLLGEEHGAGEDAELWSTSTLAWKQQQGHNVLTRAKEEASGQGKTTMEGDTVCVYCL